MEEKYVVARNEEEYATWPLWLKVLYFPFRPFLRWYLVRQLRKLYSPEEMREMGIDDDD